MIRALLSTDGPAFLFPVPCFASPAGSRFCFGRYLSCFHTRGVPNWDAISKFMIMEGIRPPILLKGWKAQARLGSEMEQQGRRRCMEDHSYQSDKRRFPLWSLNFRNSHCGTRIPTRPF